MVRIAGVTRRGLDAASRFQARPVARLARAASTTPYFPDEPSAPTVKTSIPGPESQRLMKELSAVFDTQNVNMPADFKKSIGN